MYTSWGRTLELTGKYVSDMLFRGEIEDEI